MAARRLDGIVDSATGTAHADHVTFYPRMGNQVLKGRVNVAGPFLGLHLGGLLRSHLVERSAAALAEAPQIQREHVDPRGSQLSGQVVPNLALTVALMQQQNAGSGLGRSEVCRFELCVVSRS